MNRVKYILKISRGLLVSYNWKHINISEVIEQVKIIGIDSLMIIFVTAFFIGLIFSLQIVKEFLFLNAIELVGAVLTMTFLRELSPVLTAVVLIGRIGSYFTAELATMQITEQIDALYIFNIDPLYYLIIPRVFAFMIMLPLLNIFAFLTSICSSLFICFTLYAIAPNIFLISSFSKIYVLDIIKSCFKAFVFGLFAALISCSWGMTTRGGARNVGIATTSSVVSSLLAIFILDFILSYYLFDNLSTTLI